MSHDYENMNLDEIRKLYDAIEEASFDKPHEQARTKHLRHDLDAITRLKELEIAIELARREIVEARVLVERDNAK